MLLLQKVVSNLEGDRAHVAKRMEQLDDMVCHSLDFLKPQQAERAQVELLAGTSGTAVEEAMRRLTEPGCVLPFGLPPPSLPEYMPKGKASGKEREATTSGTGETREATKAVEQEDEEPHPWCYDIFEDESSGNKAPNTSPKDMAEGSPEEQSNDRHISLPDWFEDEPPGLEIHETREKGCATSELFLQMDRSQQMEPLKTVSPHLWEWCEKAPAPNKQTSETIATDRSSRNLSGWAALTRRMNGGL